MILITTETSTSNSKDISKSEKTVSVLNRNQQENLSFHSNQLRGTNHLNFNKLRRLNRASIWSSRVISKFKQQKFHKGNIQTLKLTLKLQLFNSKNL